MNLDIAINLIFKLMGNLDTVVLTSEEKTLPSEWLEIVVSKCQYLKQDAKLRNPRFLTSKIINFSDSCVGKCRLCTNAVDKPAKYWHKSCWQAIYPYTSHYWKKIVRLERRRRGKFCAHCQLSHGKHQADHILAVKLGGKNTIDNLQFLCKTCHKIKTKIDLEKIRQSKVQSANQESLSGK